MHFMSVYANGVHYTTSCAQRFICVLCAPFCEKSKMPLHPLRILQLPLRNRFLSLPPPFIQRLSPQATATAVLCYVGARCVYCGLEGRNVLHVGVVGVEGMIQG